MIKPAVKLWTTGVVCECWSAEQQDDQSQSLHPPCFLAPLHLPFATRDAGLRPGGNGNLVRRTAPINNTPPMINSMPTGALHEPRPRCLGILLGQDLCSCILLGRNLCPCNLLAPHLWSGIFHGPDLCPRILHGPDLSVLLPRPVICPGIMQGSDVPVRLRGRSLCSGNLHDLCSGILYGLYGPHLWPCI